MQATPYWLFPLVEGNNDALYTHRARNIRKLWLMTGWKILAGVTEIVSQLGIADAFFSAAGEGEWGLLSQVTGRANLVVFVHLSAHDDI